MGRLLCLLRRVRLLWSVVVEGVALELGRYPRFGHMDGLTQYCNVLL